MTNGNKSIATAYFAHPMSSYGSAEERDVITALEKRGFGVVNPSAAEHVLNSKRIFSTEIRASGDKNKASSAVMDYFIKTSDACDFCVFTTFPDGSVSAGVAKEVRSFLDKNKTVFEGKLDNGVLKLTEVTDLSSYRCLDVASTRTMLAQLKPGYGRYNPQRTLTPAS